MGEGVVVHLVYGELQDLMQVLQAVEAIAGVLFVAQEEPKRKNNRRYILIHSIHFFSNFSCMFLKPKLFFSNFDPNSSNLLDIRNLQEQGKKAICYRKLFRPFIV